MAEHVENGTGAQGQAQPQPQDEMRIVVTENGYYEVHGGIPLVQMIIETNDEGDSWSWRQGKTYTSRRYYRLCRCGGSESKPFCDDTHLINDFDGTEVASREPYLKQAKNFRGPRLVLTDAEALCASARFCDACGSVWNLVQQDSDEAERLAIRAAAHCPSGRLRTWMRNAEGTYDPAGEPEFERSIGVVEDPAAGVSGPYFVRGRIPLFAADGTQYEVRNRMTLCRCGQSQNKPFCDGTHISVDFQDELPLTEAEEPAKYAY